MLDEQRARDYVPPIFIAAVATALGQNERALDRLERGYAMRDPYMVLLKESPLFDALRPSPRFQSIANRMKFPH